MGVSLKVSFAVKGGRRHGSSISLRSITPNVTIEFSVLVAVRRIRRIALRRVEHVVTVLSSCVQIM